jgi:hypothetical protein
MKFGFTGSIGDNRIARALRDIVLGKPESRSQHITSLVFHEKGLAKTETAVDADL